jgi:hypothetical protein
LLVEEFAKIIRREKNMKKLRLLVFIGALMVGFSSFHAPVSACEDDEEESIACPKFAPRDNGCKCCSDNHCKSGYCNGSNKCADKPLGE